MAKHSKRSSRRSRKAHRKGSRKAHRKGSRKARRKGSRSAHRFAQRGGDGYGYQGVAFAANGPMAPVESRVSYSHCGFPPRPGSLVGGARRRNRTRRSHKQRGGMCGPCGAGAPSSFLAQKGGGGGTGGYGFDITNNSMGKEYAALTVGQCPGPVRPGAQVGGADMMATRVVDSFPAGYGYTRDSAVEIGGGTAHYLNQVSYGRQCMGGGARRRHRSKKSRKAGRR